MIKTEVSPPLVDFLLFAGTSSPPPLEFYLRTERRTGDDGMKPAADGSTSLQL